GGEFATGSGAKIDLISPTTGESLGSLSAASNEQLDRAVELAQQVFEESDWSTNVPKRVEVLTRLADLVDEHRSTIAYLDAIEAGKLMSDSVDGDVTDVIDNLRYYASLVQHDDGRYLQDSGGW